MRIALTLMLLFVVTLSAFADTGRRGRWRTAPLRTWRAFDGYNVRQPGWDSGYYSPYNQGNTVQSGTPTPLTGTWQSDTTIPNAIPNTTWTDGTTTTPTQSTYPTDGTNPSTSQFINPIPNVHSEIVPSTTSPTTNDTTRSTLRRPSSSASFQLQTPQSNYWNNLNGGKK